MRRVSDFPVRSGGWTWTAVATRVRCHLCFALPANSTRKPEMKPASIESSAFLGRNPALWSRKKCQISPQHQQNTQRRIGWVPSVITSWQCATCLVFAGTVCSRHKNPVPSPKRHWMSLVIAKGSPPAPPPCQQKSGGQTEGKDFFKYELWKVEEFR